MSLKVQLYIGHHKILQTKLLLQATKDISISISAKRLPTKRLQANLSLPKFRLSLKHLFTQFQLFVLINLPFAALVVAQTSPISTSTSVPSITSSQPTSATETQRGTTTLTSWSDDVQTFITVHTIISGSDIIIGTITNRPFTVTGTSSPTSSTSTDRIFDVPTTNNGPDSPSTLPSSSSNINIGLVVGLSVMGAVLLVTLLCFAMFYVRKQRELRRLREWEASRFGSSGGGSGEGASSIPTQRPRPPHATIVPYTRLGQGESSEKRSRSGESGGSESYYNNSSANVDAGVRVSEFVDGSVPVSRTALVVGDNTLRSHSHPHRYLHSHLGPHLHLHSRSRLHPPSPPSSQTTKTSINRDNHNRSSRVNSLFNSPVTKQPEWPSTTGVHAGVKAVGRGALGRDVSMTGRTPTGPGFTTSSLSLSFSDLNSTDLPPVYSPSDPSSVTISAIKK